MAKQQVQNLSQDTMDGLKAGDADAKLEQKLVSAQNYVMVNRGAYQKAVELRAEWIALAHAAGWSKYRIAQRLGLTRRAVDEALERPRARTPLELLDAEVKTNGGIESTSIRSIRHRLPPETPRTP